MYKKYEEAKKIFEEYYYDVKKIPYDVKPIFDSFTSYARELEYIYSRGYRWKNETCANIPATRD